MIYRKGKNMNTTYNHQKHNIFTNKNLYDMSARF